MRPVPSKRLTPKPGDTVVLTQLPPGFVDDLPDEDQKAIRAIVGKPIRLTGYDGDRMELEFVELSNPKLFISHSIFVDRKYVVAAKDKSKKKKTTRRK